MWTDLPPEYRAETTDVPDFWLTTSRGIADFLDRRLTRGTVQVLGSTGGGRLLRGVTYGTPRVGRGTTTFSGSLGFRNTRAWLGPDADKRVYVGLGAVHGGEFEGIAGIMNLLAVLETGTDLRGREWPGLTAAAEQLDRLVLVPIVNLDGRDRIPLARVPHSGTENRWYQGLNTGVRADGQNLGWPHCKEFIPMDFDQVMFPGGYPNDAGVNLQHDDFFSPRRQPETSALLELCATERPDLLLNMHTGAPPKNYYVRAHRPFCEPALAPIFDLAYTALHTHLTKVGLQGSAGPALESDPERAPRGCYNLDTALNLHSGVLAILVESPCHAFDGHNREGELVHQSLDAIVDAQLACHEAAMQFLVDHGGRAAWGV